MELKFEITSPHGLNQLIQMSVGQLANFAGEILAFPKHTIPIFLGQQLPCLDIAQRYEKTYAGIEFEASRDYIRIHAGLLQQRYPDNLQDQVRDIIGQSLPSGECSLDRVATTVELSPRVLQKRLRLEGSSYVKLLQETRMTIAREHCVINR